jgi:hypothetical protein
VWVRIAATTWFTTAGLWFTLSAIDMLSQPWDLVCRSILGLAGLAFTLFLLYDSWRDARDAKRIMDIYAETLQVLQDRQRQRDEGL